MSKIEEPIADGGKIVPVVRGEAKWRELPAYPRTVRSGSGTGEVRHAARERGGARW